jgi:hypothetical protein
MDQGGFQFIADKRTLPAERQVNAAKRPFKPKD